MDDDFQDLEAELGRLRPAAPRGHLLGRFECAVRRPPPVLAGWLWAAMPAAAALKSPEEMSDVFRPLTLEAVRNTAAIAERITPSVIVDTGLKIPMFPVPGGDRTPEVYLEDLAKEGLERRLEPQRAAFENGTAKKPRQEYDARLAWELSVIRKMGLSSYFLLVWGFIKYAKDEGIDRKSTR